MNPPSELRSSNAASQARLRRIEGRHNALVKQIRRAFSRGELTEAGDCAVEGLRVIEEAVRSGVRFKAVLFSESGEKLAGRLLPQIGSHVETLVLPDKLFAGMVDSETPQGVAALVHYKQTSVVDVLERAASGPVVVLAGLQDPGNLGTIVPIARGKTVEILSELGSRGVRVVATSSHKGVLLPEANLALPMAVLVGGEGTGVSKDLLGKADEVIAIPHNPQVESLNAGVAASIVLYEIARKQSALSAPHSGGST